MNMDAVSSSTSGPYHMDPTVPSYHHHHHHPSAVVVEPQHHPQVEVAAYDEVFPALPEQHSTVAPTPHHPAAPHLEVTSKMKVKPSLITQVFHFPLEGRRGQPNAQPRFGEKDDQSKICAGIMQETGAHIEISASKDQSLTILVTGKEEAVVRAKQRLVQALQSPVTIQVSVPKDHHRFILGKKGQNLTELEQRTSTRITVPRMDDPSDVILITGIRDGVELARQRILQISDEKDKQAMERITIPKMYHPFIYGPNGATAQAIMEETGARVNIPPPAVMKDEITIAGDKAGVSAAVQRLMAIYKEKEKCQVVHMEVKKSQHKYIIGGPRGQGIQDILRETGVYVEMPPLDDPSETITLRGDARHMGAALTMVNERANSCIMEEIDAPAWLHKYIIGKNGANIREKTQDLEKVQVEFKDDINKILLEGPSDQVKEARSRLEALISELNSRLTMEPLTVDPVFHPHIVGKNGANVQKLKKDFDVQIHVPSDSDREGASHVIRIEGNPTNVAKAKKALVDMVNKLMNEVSKEIIIEQRFHRTIIGARGEKIKEIRDMFNQVNVTFPDPGTKSDKVLLRGPKEDVEACYKYLHDWNKEMLATMAQIEVPIFKQFHKYIIGKGGANIRKIREETNTKIELPGEGSDSDVIVITGKVEDVRAAQERILAIQNEQANIVQVDLMIPSKFHTSLIGTKGRLVQSIMDECGGVSIHFPLEKSGSDRVTIRGPKEDVAKAKRILLDLSNEKQESSYTDEVRAKADHIRFLIGRNGVNVKKLREKTNARIIFPSDKDEDRETIVIIGKKEDVLKAKRELEETIKDLEKIVEQEIHVDPKHHSHFITRKCEVLNQIIQDFGGVKISFPKPHENSDVVKLKGAKDCVAGAIQRIREIANDLESMVTLECVIPQDQHGAVMGAKGHKVKTISSDFKVHIKFPEKASNTNGPILNGGFAPHAGGDDLPSRKDVILITGKRDQCEAAKQALLDLVPVTEEITIPFDLHRFIIGKSGKDVRDLNDRFSVNITIPPATEQSEVVTIRGLGPNVAKARAALEERVQELEAEQQDKLLRAYTLEVEVDPRYQPKLVGPKGVVINKIRKDHDVQIQMTKGNPTISITGYKNKAEAARDTILQMVEDMKSVVTKVSSLDSRVHPRIIGFRGSNVRKLAEKYQVEITFVKKDGRATDEVEVTGKEEKVDAFFDYLAEVEEEFLQEIAESEEQKQYIFKREDRRERVAPPPAPAPEKKEFIVVGAPWDLGDFPSIGGGNADSNPPPPAPSAWGPRR